MIEESSRGVWSDQELSVCDGEETDALNLQERRNGLQMFDGEQFIFSVIITAATENDQSYLLRLGQSIHASQFVIDLRFSECIVILSPVDSELSF